MRQGIRQPGARQRPERAAGRDDGQASLGGVHPDARDPALHGRQILRVSLRRDECG
jgi:hypothetical protein